MTGWNDAYPYAVQCKDVMALPKNNPNWHKVYKWCDDCLPREWEYFNSEFRFKTERAKLLFLLRWS